MIKIHAIRVASYLLAFIVLGLVWYYYDETLELMFGHAEATTAAIAAVIAGQFGTDKELTETILSQRLHTDRFMVYFPFVVTWFIVLLACFKQEISENAARLIGVFIIAHILLTFSWLVFTDTTKAWYALNAKWITSWLQSAGYGKAVLPLVRFGQIQSLFVTVQVAMMISFLVLVPRPRWLRLRVTRHTGAERRFA